MIQQILPSLPGSYALRLVLDQPAALTVGRLGLFVFAPGMYLYLGSAHGPGGLQGRLRHHARPAERPHWHIDWLRQHARLVGGWYAVADGPLECLWAQALANLLAAVFPMPGFGASDCALGCRSHLLCFHNDIEEERIRQILTTVTAGVTPFSFSSTPP